MAFLIAAFFARTSRDYSFQAIDSIAKLIWVTFLTVQLVDTRKKLEIFLWVNIAGMVWNIKTILWEGITSGGEIRVDAGVAQGGGANYLAMILNMFVPFLFMKVFEGTSVASGSSVCS